MPNKNSGEIKVGFTADKPKASATVAKAAALSIMAEVATSGSTDKDKVKEEAFKMDALPV